MKLLFLWFLTFSDFTRHATTKGTRSSRGPPDILTIISPSEEFIKSVNLVTHFSKSLCGTRNISTPLLRFIWLVNTVFDKNKGHARPIFKQGFTGSCTYWFTKDAPVSVKNAALILAQFAEFSGLGSGVSRGCGWVEVN